MLLAAGFSGSTLAHDNKGTLPASGLAMDVYHTSCFSWDTAATAAAYNTIYTPNNVAGPAGRFVARVAKQCTANTATCSPVAGTVQISIGAESGNSTPGSTALVGANASTAAGNGNGANIQTDTYNSTTVPPSTNWVATPTAWLQVANVSTDTGSTLHNGDYFVVVNHSGGARGYWAQFHCEAQALNASPTPGSAASHTGTGVTATGEEMPDVSAGPTGGDWNYVINQ